MALYSDDTLPILLTGANMIDAGVLEEGRRTAARLNTTLDRALVLSGHLTPGKMDKALQAWQLVRTNMLSVETAVKALRLAMLDNLSVEDALRCLGDHHKKTQKIPTISNRITRLLVDAGLVSHEKVQAAIEQSLETGIQMGRVLVFRNDITATLMQAVLSSLILIDEGKINRDDALYAIGCMGNRKVTVEQVLFEQDVYKEEPGQVVKLAELFTMAGFVGDSDLLECLEIHLLKGEELSLVFVEQGLVTNHLFETAIMLQGMVSNGTLTAFQAAEALKQSSAKGITVYQAIAELNPPPQRHQPLKFEELFVASGVVSRSPLNIVLNATPQTPLQAAKKILSARLTSDEMIFAGLRCYSLNKEGFLSNENTVHALQLCYSNKVDLDDALPALGHQVPARMQFIWR